MFGGPPEGYVPTAAEQDMAARLVPSTWQHAAAAALLAHPTLARDGFVVVALALPGKSRGVWHEGQPVVPVPGLWPVRKWGTDEGDAVWFNLSTARHLAEVAANEYLRLHYGGEGVPAYVVIDDDGHAAVFEGFSAVRHG